ncbi:MAG: thermonuclease family protein [Rhizobiales bacterium]|nr:thermonuclease family protein [Hyphomicrobiales bacterium]
MTRPLWRKIADGLLFVFLAGAAIVFIRQFGADQVYSSVTVVDGDSLRDGLEDIRLHGIDAPEYRQNCSDAGGRDYPCGKRAARHLRKLVGGSSVTCRVIDTDRYDRTIGVCSAGGIELNKAMVEAGWAMAYTRHSLGYAAAEREAKRARRGIWQGRFEAPEDWRNANRTGLAGAEAVPD